MTEAKGIAVAPEGAALGAEQVPAELFKGETPQQQIGGAENLTELGKNFVFFTPGLFFTHGELDRDPVQEFMNEAKGEPQIALMSFNKPLFDGFRFKDGRRDWNHKLIAIERARWEEINAFLAGVGIMDTPRKTFYRALPFSLMIPDPVVMDRAAVLPAPLPMIEVVVYGLDGNTRKVVVEAPKPAGVKTPRVLVERPDPKTAEFAAKLFAGVDPGEAPDSETAKLFNKIKKGD